MDWKLLNVIILGLAFMLLFTAFQTASMSAKYVTNSIKKDLQLTTNLTDEEIENTIGDGYISNSVLYAVFALANFIAPSIVKIFGHKASMFVSALSYLLYIVMYLFPSPAFMYTASTIIGFGAAVIWVAQGDFLHLQSGSEKLMSRNTGIFWCMFQCSLIIGNLYITFAWQGQTEVDRKDINLLFTILSILAGAGTFAFLLLKAPFCGDGNGSENGETSDELLEKGKERQAESNQSQGGIILNSIKSSFALLVTPNMLLIAPLFLYSGFHLSFFAGIYPTSMGNTQTPKNPDLVDEIVSMSSKTPEELNITTTDYIAEEEIEVAFGASMVGMAGVAIGVGQVLGGGIFVFGSTLMAKLNRLVLLIACLVIHGVAFAFVYMNIPRAANQSIQYQSPAFFTVPNQNLALLTAFMLGVGDAGVNNVIYTSISSIWSDDSASAFALMKCIQSAACAISFACASYLDLYLNLVVLLCFSVLTVLSYVMLRRRTVRVPTYSDGEKETL